MREKRGKVTSAIWYRTQYITNTEIIPRVHWWHFYSKKTTEADMPTAVKLIYSFKWRKMRLLMPQLLYPKESRRWLVPFFEFLHHAKCNMASICVHVRLRARLSVYSIFAQQLVRVLSMRALDRKESVFRFGAILSMINCISEKSKAFIFRDIKIESYFYIF